MALDPVEQAIVAQSLIAAAQEMGVKLIRSAHSPIVREAEDCSAALLTPDGAVVAQAELIPMQLGSITHTFRYCAERHPPSEMQEGDFYITNDAYLGGQHIQDIFLFSPIFFHGKCIGFSATVVHHIDLGGGAAGMNPDAADIHAEGIVFPAMKLNRERDWTGGPWEAFVRANVRMPDATLGDIDAQFAANAVGAERLTALAEKYGAEKLADAMAEMLDYSERRVRNALREAPDGVYLGEDAIDDDGLGSGPIKVKATVTIAGDQMTIDFTGTSPQVGSNMNNPFASTVSAAVAATKSVLTDPDIPFNDGCSRAITVTAPHGSILNPRYPAPVRARLLPSYRAFDAVMKALSQAAPDRVIATGTDTTTACCLSWLGPNGYDIYLEIFGGGYGAGPENDGVDGVDCPLSNCGNIPIEAIDMDHTFFRCVDYSLIPGSGGKGRMRGGLGLRKVYEILEEGVTFATYGDRLKIPADGIFGGEAGQTGMNRVLRGDTVIDLASKCQFKLQKGDKLIVQTAAGGGYGAAQERPNARAVRDLEDGLMEMQAAE
ncbi:MAG: hydantoinase B/oxoprolinase family protein [Alphaproteobacteria bacterium]